MITLALIVIAICVIANAKVSKAKYKLGVDGIPMPCGCVARCRTTREGNEIVSMGEGYISRCDACSKIEADFKAMVRRNRRRS